MARKNYKECSSISELNSTSFIVSKIPDLLNKYVTIIEEIEV